MNFTEPLIAQYDKFFIFTGFGFLIGFVYDFALFVRELLSSKKAAWIIQDVLFSVAATISMYLMFLAYSNGEIRVILIFSAAAGFVIYKLTVGKPVKKILSKIGKTIDKVVEILLKPFKAVSAFTETQIKKIKTKLKTFIIDKKRKAKEKAKVKETANAESPQKKKDKKVIFKKFKFKSKKDLKKKQESV